MGRGVAEQSRAGERRRWVRISAACNNHCCFCLDRESLDGTVRSRDEILAELRAGRAEGAERAVLSGGEPTMHPRLPELIREARALGYRWVQIITNGRRLAYPAYLAALLEAGLDEVTVSLHGSSPPVHDAMVGSPGAFAQAFTGLRAALAARLVVSVDIVLSRRNLRDVPALLRATLAAGVREYDFLWLTPFGEAAKHLAHPQELFLRPADAGALHGILDQARAGGAVVWTNRVPLEYLEGREELAQDPSKLEDELRGRRPLLEPLVREGRPLPCRDPRRCPRCPFGAFCAELHRAAAVARGERRADTLRWDPADEAQARAAARFPAPRMAWLRTDRPAAAWRAGSREALARAASVRLEARPGVLVASLTGLPPAAVLHVRGSGGGALPARLWRNPRELVVPLDARRAAGAEPSRRPARGAPLVVALPDAGAGHRHGWPFASGAAPATRRWLRAAAAVEGLPACLAAGRAVRPLPEPFDLGWLDGEGRVEPFAILRDFIAERQRAFSFRCARCAARRGCDGVPWALARDLGLAILHPLVAARRGT